MRRKTTGPGAFPTPIMKATPVLALVVALASPLCHAEKAADLKPSIVKAGKVLADESFTSPALSPSWKVAKGDWQVVDGTLVGKEKASDKHPAVNMLALPVTNAVIRFSFKFDGSESFALSLNKEKGHLFRINITPADILVMKDKDKADPKSKGDKLAGAEAKFESGKWYTLLLEMQGAKIGVQTDNGIKLTGSDPDLDVAKTGYRFVTKGASIAVGDIKVWEAAE